MEFIRKPTLNSEDPAENIKRIDRWISETTDKLNQGLNNIDESNLSDTFKVVTQENLEAIIEKQYMELRALIIKLFNSTKEG